MGGDGLERRYNGTCLYPIDENLDNPFLYGMHLSFLTTFDAPDRYYDMYKDEDMTEFTTTLC